MNAFLISLAKNLLLGAVGYIFPPVYFLFRAKWGIALVSLLLVLLGSEFLKSLCVGLVMVSVLTQLFVDFRFRSINEENLPYTWYYRLFNWITRRLGGRQLNTRQTPNYDYDSPEPTKERSADTTPTGGPNRDDESYIARPLPARPFQSQS